MPAEGQKAPDFTLKNQDGEDIQLSDFRGQKVIIFAYPRAATSGCTTQACGFRDQMPQIETSNAVVFGLSDDPLEDLRAWKDAEGFNYDLLSDPDHEVLEAWGAWGKKSMFGNEFMGTIRSHWVIDEDGTVIDEQIKISPKKSVERAVKSLATS